jgi:signal transduction histidine kinase
MIEGRLRLDLQQVSLINVVRQAIESLELAARAKALRLESTFDPIEEAISGDPGRLRQIAWNLLSNAIKFTPSGGTVRVLLQRVSSGIELTVSDTGVGIEANFLPHVFERFSQQDSSTGRADGGLGLGLAISKQLVELHGGSIRAKSDGEGKGATFIVTLPVASTRPE